MITQALEVLLRLVFLAIIFFLGFKIGRVLRDSGRRDYDE